MTTIVQYLSDGATSTYNVPCPYIEPAHIQVKLGGFLCTLGVHYDFLTSSSIKIRPQFLPAAGTTVELRRVTPTGALVTYQNGAILGADDLNTACLQALFLAEETQAYYEAALVAGFNRLVNGSAVTSQQAIDAAVQDVLNSQLLADLQARIADITTNSNNIVANTSSIADLQNQIDVLSTIDGVGIATLIANEQQARIDGDTALADTIALIGAKNGASTAFILDLNKVQVDASTSLGTRLSGIDTTASGNAAAIASEQTARANADSALSSSVSALSATVSGNYGTLSAAISNEQTARANGDTANASSITTLQSTVNGHTSSISTIQSVQNGLTAQYMVKLDVNGRVVGFGLYTDGATSDFIVVANRFSIVDPGNSAGAPTVPFTVSGGVVYMQNVVIGNALISDLTLTKLTSGTLNADMNMGTGKIIWDNGAYMKVAGVGFGSANQFLEWFGPHFASLSSCTEANAISYLKTNGSAYFGGTLLSGVLSNSVVGSVLNATNIADLGPFSSNGNTITINWSYVFLGHTAFPGTSQGLTDYNATTKQTPSATLILSRNLNGAGFVDVATLNITNGAHTELAPVPVDLAPGFYNQTMSGSGTYTDPSLLAQQREYKLRFSGGAYTNVNAVVTQNDLSLHSTE